MPPLPLCLPAGKKASSLKAQCLFLPYIDALSVVVDGKELDRPHRRLQQAADERAAGAAEGEGELNFLPPAMPSFSRIDLDFICHFTEVSPMGGRAPGAAGHLG